MNPIASNGLGKDWYIFQTIIAKLAKLQTLSIKQWICVYETVLLLAEQNRRTKCTITWLKCLILHSYGVSA